jgi:hypothetical protein
MPWWQRTDLTLNIYVHLNMIPLYWRLWMMVLTILACFKNRESFPHCIHGCFLANQPYIWTWIASRCLYNRSVDFIKVDLKVGTCIKRNWYLGLLQTCAKGIFSAALCMYVSFGPGHVTVHFKTLFKAICHHFILVILALLPIIQSWNINAALWLSLCSFNGICSCMGIKW